MPIAGKVVPQNPFAFTEEREQLRKEIREFAAREILPNVMRWDEASEFPADVVKQLGADGAAGDDLSDGVWRRGAGLCGVCAGDGGAVGGRWLHRDYCGVA